MPTISATDGNTTVAVDQIKRIDKDLSSEDIRNMGDEELAEKLALLRRSRETTPPKAGKSSGPRASKPEAIAIVDDSDMESDV